MALSGREHPLATTDSIAYDIEQALISVDQSGRNVSPNNGRLAAANTAARGGEKLPPETYLLHKPPANATVYRIYTVHQPNIEVNGAKTKRARRDHIPAGKVSSGLKPTLREWTARTFLFL